MLYRLEIENFFAIRDSQVIDVTVAPNVPDKLGRFAELFPGSELRAPKVIALYGPNASGKTTVLKALDFLIRFARDSAHWQGLSARCERFNDEDSASRPIRLAVEFGGVMDLTPAVSHALDQGEEVEFGVYRYEVCLNVAQGNVTTVREEALRQRPQGKGKWQRVFERNERGELSASKSFLMGGFKHLLNTLPPSASVLSSFAVFQHPTAKIFVDRLQSCLTNMPHGQPRDDSALAAFFANSPHLVTALNHDLRRIDVGVEQMQIVDTPTGPVPFFRHEGLQVDMPWGLESHGTQAFIRVFPFLAITLERGGVAIIDELDALLHPVVLPDILTWYYDKHQRNKFDAQLWMSCNSASLLDDLTKEQVVLCDKDRRGRSTVYSLMDVKSVRRDDNLYRKYLSGAYGAIPNIG